MRILLAVVVALAGCVQTTPAGTDEAHPGPATEGWWSWVGMQCRPTPWDQWAQSSGHQDRGEAAKEPYENDPVRANRIVAYYEQQGWTALAARAHNDEMDYVASCGVRDGWYYYLHIGYQTGQEPTAPPGEWTRSPTPPKEWDPTWARDQASDEEGQWWYQSGVQCEAMPWSEYAETYDTDDPEADEPYENDPYRAGLIRSYYGEERGVTMEDSRAYYDDRVYPSVCGAANGWHYWVLAPESFNGSADGWSKRGDGPDVPA